MGHAIDFVHNPYAHLCFVATLRFCFLLFIGFSKFLFRVFYSVSCQCKVDKQQSKNWSAKEPFLGFLAIFVHGVPDYFKVYTCAFHKTTDILLLKVMRQYNRKHSICHEAVITLILFIWGGLLIGAKKTLSLTIL